MLKLNSVYITLFILLAGFLVEIPVNNKNQNLETHFLRDFDSIKVNTACRLYIQAGDEYEVVVKGNRAQLECLNFSLSENELVIDWQKNRKFMLWLNNWWFKSEKVEVYLKVPQLALAELHQQAELISNVRIKKLQVNQPVSSQSQLLTASFYLF